MRKSNININKNTYKSTGTTHKNMRSGILENSIIDNIYRMEYKRTILRVLKYIISFLILFLTSIFVGISIFNILSEQKTFDLLELFRENMEIITGNLPEVISTFITELPAELTITFVIFIILTLLTLFLIIHNFEKIKNRIKSINKYYYKGR